MAAKVPLGEVCEITMGQAPSGDSYNTQGDGVALIAGAGDFGDLTPEPTKFTTAPTKLSRPNEVILCIRATIGDRNWSDKTYCLGRGVAGLLGKKGKLEQNYLWHWIGHAAPELKAKGRGATFLQVSKADIASLEIPLPPPAEQRRIAAILDKADALRAKRREAIAKLDQLLQSVFLDMFGDPATNPKGWPECELGNVVHAVKDGPHVSPKYSDVGVPFLSTRHIRAGVIKWEDLKYISDEDAEVQWKKCRPQRGDILYTKGGTTGLAAAVDTDKEFAVWVHVALLKTNFGKVDPTWLAAMLNSKFCYEQSQRYTHGIANRDLGLKRMVQIKLFQPPLPLQQRYARFAEATRLQRERLSHVEWKLSNLMSSMQHRVFAGTL